MNFVLVMALVVLPLPFAIYAADRGAGLVDPQHELASRLFTAGAPVSNAAIFGHMVAGAAIMVLAPLQLLPAVRRAAPVVHRASGYAVAVLAVGTGLGGLWYIVAQGTIGGTVMDLGFGLYGVLMVWAAVATVHFARHRDQRHRLWAERLVILALASWLYRVHYGIWEIATGGIGSTPEFSGPFDLVQVFAFYLPYLLMHHALRRHRVHDPLV